ncbi:MAG: ribonuclease E/G [Acidobacteriota bacterium]
MVDRRILVSADPRETRVALQEGGALVEVAIERQGDRPCVGNIYQGLVSRVLPGMQSAFVNVGLERDAFLHVTDFVLPESDDSRIPRADRSPPPIETLLREGHSILVQVAKEAIAGKGARVTTVLTLPGRYLVLLPRTSHVAISRKIEDEQERERLRREVSRLPLNGAGCIVRTAAAGSTAADLAEDMAYLQGLWRAIHDRAACGKAPALLHEDLDRPLQLLRDLFGGSVSEVLVEGTAAHGKILDFVATLAPRAARKVQRYTGAVPLFEALGIRREIERALRNKVWLKSGGTIFINQTEALVAVDVNTGKYTGRRNLEETILKINLEAVHEIVRQLRLRDLGGIIVIDFIDMKGEEPRHQVFQALRAVLARDRAKTYLHELSDFGLVQITRRRARRSLERTLCRPCPACHGSGSVKSPSTVASDIVTDVRSTLASGRFPSVVIRAHPEVVDAIEAEGKRFVEALAVEAGCELTISSDPSLPFAGYKIEVPPC